MSSGVSLAFAAAVQALATAFPEKPLPKGINTATVGDWTITLNTTNEPLKCEQISDPVGPFELHATNNNYLAFAIIGPSGGAVGGMTEEQFTFEMEAIANAQVSA